MINRILQIVPRLPPHTDGVGDYGLKLAKQLLKDQGINTHFLVFQQNIALEKSIEGFPVTCLPSHDCNSFLSSLPPNIEGILLQYSNYPYLRGKVDAPFWLADALQSAIAERAIPLTVIFHELPWLRWKGVRVLNPLQSQVSRRLGRVSTVLVTNNTQFQKILEGWLDRPVQCLLNFSNVGELEQPLLVKDRKRQLVVFGSTDRDRVYRHALSEIRQLYHQLDLEVIYDIGNSLGLRQKYDFQAINLVEMGFQPAEIVSQLLSESLFCAIDYSYFPGNLGKSGVFAAACAHGIVPLCTRYNPSEADGLILNQHYLLLDRQQNCWHWDDLQTVANSAYQWYATHRLTQCAKVVATTFKTNGFAS